MPPELTSHHDIVARPAIVSASMRFSSDSSSAADLIRLAQENPPEPIIEGLLFKRDLLVLHGKEESYKSILVVQIAESIATGRPLLRAWNIPYSRRVGIIETEMHPTMIGTRLAAMFPSGDVPPHLLFMSESKLKQWRRAHLPDKVAIIADWVRTEAIDVLMIDTANDFFRGEHNPSDERHVGELFDQLRNLSLDAIILVRHDHKRRDGDNEEHTNELIRGSAEWKEDPEAILHIARQDKRTNEAKLEVGKLRYCSKPEPIPVWFDAGCFRLTPLPPIVAVLSNGPKSRQDLVAECRERFGVEDRLVGGMLSEQEPYLLRRQDGHNAIFEIAPDRFLEAPWATFLTAPGQ
jgi:AAA domain